MNGVINSFVLLQEFIRRSGLCRTIDVPTEVFMQKYVNTGRSDFKGREADP